MQIVIKITKKLYDRYKEKDHIKMCDIDEFEKALDKCIILPKDKTLEQVTEFADRCQECRAKYNELLKEKTAHWIRWYEEIEHDKYVEHVPYCKCSECGKEYNPYSNQLIKYCSNCGRKMVEQQEWPLPEYKESEEE